jgi:hypothetical protein
MLAYVLGSMLIKYGYVGHSFVSLIYLIFNQYHSLSVSNRNRILVGMIVRSIGHGNDELTNCPTDDFGSYTHG